MWWHVMTTNPIPPIRSHLDQSTVAFHCFLGTPPPGAWHFCCRILCWCGWFACRDSVQRGMFEASQTGYIVLFLINHRLWGVPFFAVSPHHFKVANFVLLEFYCKDPGLTSSLSNYINLHLAKWCCSYSKCDARGLVSLEFFLQIIAFLIPTNKNSTRHRFLVGVPQPALVPQPQRSSSMPGSLDPIFLLKIP